MRSAAHANHRNRRVPFKLDVKESLKLSDNKPRFFWKDSHHKHKWKNTNNDVLNIARSKANYTDFGGVVKSVKYGVLQEMHQ
jgi:hypothetical protein